ncbi:MAG: UDP-4-amino-4,6-dideoxy-N-acetyl-beta-L-altrosamine transaminase [Candidatus Electronema sp. VV]
MLKRIPYGRQDINQADIQVVVDVLQSDFLTQGPAVPAFEQAVRQYCGVSHVVAVNSATSALHIACLALGVGKGDIVWTSPNTFVASANCALYCGAIVDFVDIDSRTYNMSIECLAEKLEQAEREGCLPKIVIPVHYSGQPCDMPAIHELSLRYGFKIIEDASHAIGASYRNIKIGSCAHSNITVFSFHPVKIITTGEGGMALTNDLQLANCMRRLRTHGITSDKELMQSRPENEIWNYQQIELGFNYRMTDIQAVLGLNQLTRLDEFVKRRHEIAKRYDEKFGEFSIIIPWQSPEVYSSYHLYPIRIRESQYKKTQRQIYDEFWKNGVAVNLHYIPVHRQPYYENMGFKKGDFPESEKFHREVISLPMYPTLENFQQEKVIKILREALSV